MTLNINAIKTAVTGAFKSADGYNAYVTTLRTLCAGADRDAIKNIVCPIAAKRYGAEYIDGKWSDKDCAAKRYANRLIAAIMGTKAKSSGKTEADPVAQAIEVLSKLTPAQLRKVLAAVAK